MVRIWRRGNVRGDQRLELVGRRRRRWRGGRGCRDEHRHRHRLGRLARRRLAGLTTPDGGRLGVGQPGRVADELAQRVADPAGRGQVVGAASVRPGRARVGVEDGVAQRVEHARDTRAYLARAQYAAVGQRRLLDHRTRLPGPTARQRGVQESDHPGDVGRCATRGQAVQGGVDGEPDDADRTGAVDQHVLGHQPAVSDAGGVGDLEGGGHLADDPGRPSRGERTLGGQQDVEGDAGRPLVDHEAQRRAVARGLVGRLVDVEDPQQTAVDHPRGGAGGVAQQGGAVVVGPNDVHRHRAVERGVVRPVEQSATALVEQVDQVVAVGQDVAGADRVRHGPPPWQLVWQLVWPLIWAPVHRRCVTASWCAVPGGGRACREPR